MNENDTTAPYSGSSALSIRYTPCAPGLAGIIWWDPLGSKWCQKPGGFDLTGWTKLTFWAKGEKGGEVVEFKVGGLATPDGEPCDSMALA